MVAVRVLYERNTAFPENNTGGIAYYYSTGK